MSERSETLPIKIIELWPIWFECHICGEDTAHKQGIAVYEDMIFTDDYEGEWFGAPVCEVCWKAVQQVQAQYQGCTILESQVRAALRLIEETGGQR